MTSQVSIQITGNPTSTSVYIGTILGMNGGPYDVLEVQYATRPDFSFCLAPIFKLPVSGLGGGITLFALNQGVTYFIRAREYRSDTQTSLDWSETVRAYTPIANAQVTTPLSIMVRPAIIVPPEDVKWSLSAAEDPAHPADNLASDSPAEQLWFNPNTGLLRFDTGGQPIDTIALLGTNLPADAQWHVEGFPTAAARALGSASATYSSATQQFHASPNLPGRPCYNGLIRLPAPRTEPYWTIVIAGAGGIYPPANQVVAMFGVVGLARTAKNIAADKAESPIDLGAVERTRDGIPDRRYGWRGRRVEFQIALMTEAQWETQFSDLRYKVGMTEPVLVVPNTRTGAFLHDRILYGVATAQRAQQPYTPRFTQDFTIDSLI